MIISQLKKVFNYIIIIAGCSSIVVYKVNCQIWYFLLEEHIFWKISVNSLFQKFDSFLTCLQRKQKFNRNRWNILQPSWKSNSRVQLDYQMRLFWERWIIQRFGLDLDAWILLNTISQIPLLSNKIRSLWYLQSILSSIWNLI